MNQNLLLEAASDQLKCRHCEILEPFKYSPLKDGEIRILNILPGERENAIICQMRHEKLDGNLNYDALSYAWGLESASDAIEVDRKTFLVTPNLHAALLELRTDFSKAHHHNKELVSNSKSTFPGHAVGLLQLWVDAICINQEDNFERLHQVLLMGKIYESAARLHIWLGSEQDDSDLAIAFIASTVEHPRRNEAKVNDLTEHMSLSAYVKTYQAVAMFFARNWFYRAWIIQEYVLSATEDTILYCGTSRISVNKIKLANLGTIMDSPKLAGVGESVLDAHAAVTLRWSQLEDGSRRLHKNKIRRGETTSLLLWLLTNRTTKATDERDKVYSVLGLAHTAYYDPYVLIVDYDASVQDVYSSVVKSVISATRRLNILGACAERGVRIQRTWTPDWTMPSRSHRSTLGFLCGEQEDRKDGFNASKNFEAVLDFAHDLTTLTARGLLWDVVDGTFPERKITDTLSSPGLATMKICYQVFWEYFNQRRIYETEKMAKESLWRILLFESQTLPTKVLDLDSLGLEEEFHRRFTLEEAYELAMQASNPSVAELARGRGLNGKESCWYTQKLLTRLQDVNSAGELLLTTKGYVGKVGNRSKVKEGDLICILLGSDVPIVLRAIGDYHELIADVYVDGIMYGEAMEALERGEVALQDFVLH